MWTLFFTLSLFCYALVVFFPDERYITLLSVYQRYRHYLIKREGARAFSTILNSLREGEMDNSWGAIAHFFLQHKSELITLLGQASADSHPDTPFPTA